MIKRTLFPLLVMLALFLSGCATAVRQETAHETKAQKDARMAWWREAKFGMFIHWGVYSVPAGTYDGKRIPGIGEWIMNTGRIPVDRYRTYAEEFDPVKYDADAWVRLAKEAGMKYIVITAKHHDGFAMFDSKVSDWNIVDATPYHKDPLKDLAAACQKYGIRLGFYYSQAQDWNHPGGAARGGHWDRKQNGSMDAYIKNIAVPQVRELLSDYGPVSVLWWDTPVGMNKERADQLAALLALQPGIITNNRLGGGYAGDTETPEQQIPATGAAGRDWETCMTMNDTWGYKSYDDNWKSTRTLLTNLVDIASKGGNYLLNVGPTSSGEIPQPSVERLEEIGTWMKVNGESIYGTTANPFAKVAWGRVTKKVRTDGATLYLHVFDWPEDGEIRVPGLRNDVAKAYLLANGKAVETGKIDDSVTVKLPGEAPDAMDSVVVLEVTGPLDAKIVLPKPDGNGALSLGAGIADIHNPGYGGHARLESKSQKQAIVSWTDSRAWLSWDLVIDKPGTYDVFATVAGPAASTFTISVGGDKVTAKVKGTGDYAKFERVRLGAVEVRKAGETTLKIVPNGWAWKALDLRSVELLPSKRTTG